MITIKQLEEKLFHLEMVRVFFRLPSSVYVADYHYKNMVSDSNNVSILVQRLETLYPDIPFNIIDGRGVTDIRLGRKMKDIRDTYIKGDFPC